MHEVVTIATPGLGDRSYLVHDGETGIVVDAQRDIDRFLTAAAEAGVRLESSPDPAPGILAGA